MRIFNIDAMSINERFGKIIRILYGGNKRAFATDIGIAPTVVENIVGKRQGKPSFDVVEKVCALANVNTEWLITGRGEPFDFSNDDKQTSDISISTTPVEQNEDMVDKLLAIIQEKDKIIREQAEEIGQLRERINMMERKRGVDASGAQNSGIASAG